MVGSFFKSKDPLAPPDARRRLRDPMDVGLAVSAAVHVAVIVLLIFGLPHGEQPLEVQDTIPVNVVDVSQLTAAPKIQPNPTIKSPPTPTPKPPTPPPPPPATVQAPPPPTPPVEQQEQPTPPKVADTPAPRAPAPPPQMPTPTPPKAETPPAETTEAPSPVVAPPEAKPQPPKPEPPKPAPKTVAPPKTPPKQPPQKTPPKPQQTALSSLLKNVEKLKQQEPTQPQTQPQQPTQSQPQPDLQTLAARISDRLTASEEDALRRQFAACWNPPVGAKNAQNLIVDIIVQVNADRTVASAQIVDQAREASDPFYRMAAESARRAVLNPRCSPLDLPADKYDQWKTILFHFDPRDML